jgi:hypothetical protein
LNRVFLEARPMHEIETVARMLNIIWHMPAGLKARALKVDKIYGINGLEFPGIMLDAAGKMPETVNLKLGAGH